MVTVKVELQIFIFIVLLQSRVVSLRPAEYVQKKFEAMWAEYVSPHTQVYQEPEPVRV